MDKEALTVHLCQLEEKLLKQEVRSSQKDLTNILADQFFEIGSSGRVLYKNEDISETGISLVQMKLDNFEIHTISDDVVLATYRIFNESTQQYSLRSSIWKLQDQRWQMFFHQGTKTSLTT